jgi:hypothetical protein
LTFAGNTTTFAANTIKINLVVQNWPFYALANFLSIVMDANVTTSNMNPDNCGNLPVVSQSDVGNLRWITVDVAGVTLYQYR